MAFSEVNTDEESDKEESVPSFQDADESTSSVLGGEQEITTQTRFDFPLSSVPALNPTKLYTVLEETASLATKGLSGLLQVPAQVQTTKRNCEDPGKYRFELRSQF